MEQYRDTCVNRKLRNRGKKDPIRLSFNDTDGIRIDDITREEAECIAAKNKKITFFFQDGNGFQRELDIECVRKLKPNKDLVSGAPACPTSPQFCGPPKVQFFGGNGIGAIANPIISPESSSIIGFDLVNPGKNYLEAPVAEIVDECLNGSGAKIKVNMIEQDEDSDIDDCIRKSVRGTLDSKGDFTPVNASSNLCPFIVGTFKPDDGSCEIPGILKPNLNKFKSDKRLTTNKTGTFVPNDFPQKKKQKVKNLVVLAPGNGFLSAPDGSMGGNGRVWKRKNEGYSITCSDTFYVATSNQSIPFDPLTTPGDSGISTSIIPDDVYIPPSVRPVNPPIITFTASNYNVLSGENFDLIWQTSNANRVSIEPGIGNVGLNGRVTVSIASTTVYNLTAIGVGGTITQNLKINVVSRRTPTPEPPLPPLPPVPPLPPEPPTPNPSGTYKVLLCLDEVEIANGGFGYKPGDTARVVPENGSKVEAVINDKGRVIEIKVLSKGCGYTDLPQIIMESETGYNATFYPVLSATRILNEEDLFNIPTNVPLVSVVDCVGVIK